MDDPSTYYTPLRMRRPFAPGAVVGGGGGSPVTFTVLAHGTANIGASSFPTVSVAPESNKPIYCFFGYTFNGGPPAGDCFAVAGNGLTWDRIDEQILGTGRWVAGAFRSLGASPTPGVITISETDAGDGLFLTGVYAIVQANDADPSGTNGSGATGAPGANSTDSDTALGLTIPGSPGPNDATLAFFVLEDGATGITADALWTHLFTPDNAGDMSGAADWSSGADLTPTLTWTNPKRAAGIGFIVKAA